MGAVLPFGVGTEEVVHATASAIARGMRLTFVLAGGMMLVAITVAVRQAQPMLSRAKR